MITFLCGIPGHGKTLLAVSRVAAEAEKDGRPVYYAGIPDCKVPGWLPIPGGNEFESDGKTYTADAIKAVHQWPTLPKRSVIVVDEAHLVFPQRGPSAAVPPWVAAAAVLRNDGHDLVLLTQDGGSVDHFFRRRCGRYFHVWRTLGLERCTVWEFPRWLDWEDYHNRKLAQRSSFNFPKDRYSLYKSANVHTVKRRIPGKIFMLPLLVLACAGALYFGYKSLLGSSALKGKDAAKSASPSPAASGLPLVAAKAVAPRSASEVLLERVPRVYDLPHSAPMYDDLVKPLVFPVVSACVASASRCICYTQQGTRVPQVAPSTCADFVRHGQFNPYQVASSRVDGGSSHHAKPPSVEPPYVPRVTGMVSDPPPSPAKHEVALPGEGGAGRRAAPPAPRP